MSRASPSSALPAATWLVLGIAFLGTVAIFALPDARFAARMPRARLAVESIAGVVALMVSALSYLRYWLERARFWLLLAVAFLALGVNQMVFGVVLEPDTIGPNQASYFWTAGRLIVGILLLVASLPRTRRTWDGNGHLRRFGLLAAAVLVLLAVVETSLWAERSHLPALGSTREAVAEASAAALVDDLTPVMFIAGVMGAALFLAAALGFLRRGVEPAPPWLPPALVLAAASHIHHMFFPSVFTDLVSTGDVLRTAFGLTLLGGLLWEVRGRFVSERDRSIELASAYARERARTGQLEALDRAKAEFFSVLTHELLQPVAAVRGLVATLRRRRELAPHDRAELFQRLDEESRRLRDMAEGASTAMHLQDPGFSIAPAPVRAADIVRQAAATPAELGDRLEVRMEPLMEDVQVEVDLGRILQVLRNLLSNAAKYADPGSAVELRAELRNGNAIFAVSDQGPGLVASDLDRVFGRFSRVRPAGREHVRGSGLGLYISRRIAEAHGGTLEADSTPGEGSEFRLILPARDRR